MKSPWIAALLSAFALGAGHLYVGRALRFVIALSVLVSVWSILIFGGYLSTFVGFIIQILIPFVFVIFAVVDPAIIARRTPVSTQRWYLKWPVLITYIVVLPFIMLDLKKEYHAYSSSGALGYGIYFAEANSMAPIIIENDFVLIDTRYYKNRSPAVGDVVLVRSLNSEREFIRRVRLVTGASVWLSADSGGETASAEFMHNVEVPIANIVGRPTVILVSKDAGRAGIVITGEDQAKAYPLNSLSRIPQIKP